MSDQARPLRILLVLRAPVGGLFRHVLDLARAHIERGHQVGVIADSLTGGERGERALAELAPSLALGLSRVAMPRQPSFADVPALRHVVKRIKACAPDVVHGHGSKGGVYARLGAKLAGGQAASAYTPHGGSFNYRPGTLAHHVFMMIEGALRPLTDIYLFESAFMARKMREEVGPARALQRVVLNGLSDAEFQPVAPAPDAGDFLYIGELRSVKGIDTMLEALAKLHARTALRPTLTIVGTGPDEALLKGQAETLGLSPYVTFAGAMNAREAFSRARAMIVPSRAESLPYVVLEAAAARLPLLSTNVGGIGEIFGPESHRLFPPGDAELLAERMSATLRAPAEELSAQSQALFDHVRGHFSIADMADQALAGYRDAIAAKAYRASQISPPSSGAISFSPKA